MNFIAGEKCFAKVKGFPHWPARINCLPPNVKIPKGKYPIFFYGTYEVCFLPQSAIYPYEKNKLKFGNPRNKSSFNKGIQELENNPTILQYGSDPEALTFLSQFYKFSFPKDMKTTLPDTDKEKVIKKESILNIEAENDIKQESVDCNLGCETSSQVDISTKNIIQVIESQIENSQNNLKDSNEIYIMDSTKEILSHNDENEPPTNVNDNIEFNNSVDSIHLSKVKSAKIRCQTDEYASDLANLLSEIRKYSWFKTKNPRIKRSMNRSKTDSRIKLFYPWYQSLKNK